ncbi:MULTISPECIES: Ig-like domain-containing protein [unclassified Arthrobacter]|uniref:Ig-like domain-containing protein n=1 Tax=unclassified Arthrobacter TaxID=235627 RepID=UPI0027D8FA53|nr:MULTISPECIES: Ig-like domain-containing protein [unclassified Arthrobacter]
MTTRTPAADATAVAVGTNITATFNEAVQAVSGTTFTLRTGTATGTAVAGAVTYDAATRVATLNPTANLSAGTTHTASLTGGGTAIRDAANNALAMAANTRFTAGLTAGIVDAGTQPHPGHDLELHRRPVM